MRYSPIKKSLDARDVNASLARSAALDRIASTGASGLLQSLSPGPVSGFLSEFSSSGQDAERYRNYRHWVYSAVNALALQGSGQAANVVRLLGTGDQKQKPKVGEKQYATAEYRKRMPSHLQAKASNQQIEVLNNHPILTALEKPNPVQYRFQFIYSFIANLALTGWSYLVGGETEDGSLELYSVPTTWIKPVHRNELFSEFRLVNPNNPTAEGVLLSKENVAFAQLPDPSDLSKGLAPADAQENAISIDTKIQTSQRSFFDNGIFPSVIVTVGRDPHPDVPGGIRPRLTAPQRRQVIGAIRKVAGGISNYGNPAIVDGLIEKIERLSATQTEMGWEKSEGHVRTRILSAYGVHPFILGETMAGSYAQAYVVKDQFCSRVNTFLDLLGVVSTDFLVPMASRNDSLRIWYDPCEAKDPALDQKLWTDARRNQDVTQNEFRAFMGLPPDVDRNESVISHQALQGVLNIAAQSYQGKVSPEQASAILEAAGIPTDLAERISGSGLSVSQGIGALEEAMRALGGMLTDKSVDAAEIAQRVACRV